MNKPQIASCESESGEPSAAATAFYGGALHRVRRMMLALTAGGTLGTWAWLGWRFALGLLVGCAIAYLNFYWLKQVVSALADRTTRSGRRESGGAIVFRFLVRYALIAVAAYAIFKISPGSLYGLLGGLFLTVAAILCEAAYEAWVAIRRGL